MAQVLRPMLVDFAEVLTAGRSGCDITLDLAWPIERLNIPSEVDVIINLAAHFGGATFADLLAAEEVNALGPLKLVHVAAAAGVKQFIQISSIFAGLEEDSPFFSSYALTKRHGEDLLQQYCRQSGLPLTILRPAQIYGEGTGFRRHQPVLYALLDKAERGEDIVLYGTNDAKRNFIYAEDVAEIIARVVRKCIVGRYTCASLRDVCFSEMAEAAVAAFASASTIHFDPTKPDIADNAFGADDTLYRLIDYFPLTSLNQGLAREAARRRSTR